MYFWIGTYTQCSGPGVSLCRVCCGRIEEVYTDSDFINPTYLILSPDKRSLYVVCGGGGEYGEQGQVVQLALEFEPAELSEAADIERVRAMCASSIRRVACQGTGGEDPCHLALNSDGTKLYVANYGSGSLAVFPIVEGVLGERAQLIEHEGHGTNPERQKRPHVHHVSCVPGTDMLCAVDLGLDKLIIYEPRSDGRLHHKYELDVPAGYGPRHVAYAPDFENNGVAYVCHELGNAVSVLQCDIDAIINGTYFELEQTLSTLPAGADAALNAVAAIKLSQDGTRLYVSNRGFPATDELPEGNNSIAEYGVGAEGLLELRDIFAAGAFPRDFQLLPDDSILVADQNYGLTLISEQREIIARLPMPGAVCVCPM